MTLVSSREGSQPPGHKDGRENFHCMFAGGSVTLGLLLKKTHWTPNASACSFTIHCRKITQFSCRSKERTSYPKDATQQGDWRGRPQFRLFPLCRTTSDTLFSLESGTCTENNAKSLGPGFISCWSGSQISY